jgi:cell division protein FtsB
MMDTSMAGFLLAFLGGGGLAGLITALSTHFLGKRKQSTDMTAVINEGFAALLKQQQDENDRLVSRILDLENTITDLKTQLGVFEKALRDNNITVPPCERRK